jgi:hypothetical protein
MNTTQLQYMRDEKCTFSVNWSSIALQQPPPPSSRACRPSEPEKKKVDPRQKMFKQFLKIVLNNYFLKIVGATFF